MHLVAKRNRNTTPNQIVADIAITTSADVSGRTISRRSNWFVGTEACSMHLASNAPSSYKDYVGVKNILFEVSNSGLEGCFPMSCDFLWKWLWPLVSVERMWNMLFTTINLWMWWVWPRHTSMGRRYAQRHNINSYLWKS